MDCRCRGSTTGTRAGAPCETRAPCPDTGGRAANLGLPRELTGAYLVAPGPASEVFQQNGYHAVLYHGPSDSYRFHSTEHRRAAERMFPEAAARGAAVICDDVFVYEC